MLGLGFGYKNGDFDHVMMKVDFNGQLVTIWLCVNKKWSVLSDGIGFGVAALGDLQNWTWVQQVWAAITWIVEVQLVQGQLDMKLDT